MSVVQKGADLLITVPQAWVGYIILGGVVLVLLYTLAITRGRRRER